jgi:hypothetical protein
MRAAMEPMLASIGWSSWNVFLIARAWSASPWPGW